MHASRIASMSMLRASSHLALVFLVSSFMPGYSRKSHRPGNEAIEVHIGASGEVGSETKGLHHESGVHVQRGVVRRQGRGQAVPLSALELSGSVSAAVDVAGTSKVKNVVRRAKTTVDEIEDGNATSVEAWRVAPEASQPGAGQGPPGPAGSPGEIGPPGPEHTLTADERTTVDRVVRDTWLMALACGQIVAAIVIWVLLSRCVSQLEEAIKREQQSAEQPPEEDAQPSDKGKLDGEAEKPAAGEAEEPVGADAGAEGETPPEQASAADVPPAADATPAKDGPGEDAGPPAQDVAPTEATPAPAESGGADAAAQEAEAAGAGADKQE